MSMSRPLVLLHGFTGHASSWDPIRAQLKRPSTAYTLFGHDGLLVDESSFEAEVDRLAGLIRREFRGKPTCICGYSLGGRVALVLLARYPKLFDSGVLIGASPGLESQAERTKRAAADQHYIDLLESQKGSASSALSMFIEAWEMQPIFASQLASTRDEQRRVRSRHHPIGLARAMHALGLSKMPNMWPLLPSIDMSILLVTGALDEKFRVIAEQMRALLPRARLEIVAGAGHNILAEQPAVIAKLLEHA